MSSGTSTAVDNAHEVVGKGEAEGAGPKGGAQPHRAQGPGRRPEQSAGEVSRADIERLTERLGAAESTMSARSTAIEKQGRTLGELKEKVEGLNNDVTELKAKVEELGGLGTKFEEVRRDISARLTKAKVPKVAEDDSVPFVTTEQFTELASRVEELEKLGERIEAIEAALKGVDFKDISMRVQTAITSEQLDKRLEAVGDLSVIKALSERLGRIQAELDAEKAKVITLQGQVVADPTFKSVMRTGIVGPVKIGHVVGSVAVFGVWQAVARWGIPMVKPEWTGLQGNIGGNIGAVVVGAGGSHWLMTR